MKLQRNIVKIIKGKEDEFEENVVSLNAAECVSFVWDLTEEIYSLAGVYNAESRLQRNVVNIIRK